MPVLPLVGSTIVPPGFSLPSRSAASMMRVAMRSFDEPPGFRYSTLTSTVAAMPSVTVLQLDQWRVADQVEHGLCVLHRIQSTNCRCEPTPCD